MTLGYGNQPQNIPLSMWIELKNWPVLGHTPQKCLDMVSSLILVNEMHGDDNKAPTEIAKTTLGHPDD